jgi:hypothetical protein
MAKLCNTGTEGLVVVAGLGLKGVGLGLLDAGAVVRAKNLSIIFQGVTQSHELLPSWQQQLPLSRQLSSKWFEEV